VEDERAVYISEVAIAEYLWIKLLEKGHAPTSDDVFDIAEIMFDYLEELGIMEVVEREEE
jgi:hypothetical protein